MDIDDETETPAERKWAQPVPLPEVPLAGEPTTPNRYEQMSRWSGYATRLDLVVAVLMLTALLLGLRALGWCW